MGNLPFANKSTKRMNHGHGIAFSTCKVPLILFFKIVNVWQNYYYYYYHHFDGTSVTHLMRKPFPWYSRTENHLNVFSKRRTAMNRATRHAVAGAHVFNYFVQDKCWENLLKGFVYSLFYRRLAHFIFQRGTVGYGEHGQSIIFYSVIILLFILNGFFFAFFAFFSRWAAARPPLLYCRAYTHRPKTFTKSSVGYSCGSFIFFP